MPTPEQLQRERAVFSAFIYDCMLIAPYLWISLSSGSMTLLAELLRGVLLVSVAVLSWLTLRKIHRGRTGAYDFGMGKVEQGLSLLVALLLCASMAFVWYKVLGRGEGSAHATNTMSYMAVGLSIVNLFANAAPLFPLWKAMKTGRSVLVTTQFRAKSAKTIGSVVVAFCVALNQLSGDPAIAMWSDRIGVLIVSVVTFHAAWELLRSAVPDLLDRTLPEHHQVAINQVLARHYEHFDALNWVRSRQSGSDIEVHLGLGFPGSLSFAHVSEISKKVMAEIEAAIPGSRAIVTPVLADRPAAAE